MFSNEIHMLLNEYSRGLNSFLYVPKLSLYYDFQYSNHMIRLGFDIEVGVGCVTTAISTLALMCDRKNNTYESST